MSRTLTFIVLHMKLKYIPNIITIIRLILIAPFVALAMHGNYPYALYVFWLAGLSDGLDGWLARHFNWQSEFGGFIDPLADKLLIMTSFLILGSLGQIPWWLVLLVFARDICILISVIAWYVFISTNIHFQASLLSKINTLFQLMLVTLCLFQLAYGYSYDTINLILILLTTITTTLTYFAYAWTWGKKAYQLKLQA